MLTNAFDRYIPQSGGTNDTLHIRNRGKMHKMSRINDGFAILVVIALVFLLVVPQVYAATTQLHVVKYASDDSTILAEKTLTYQEMEATLPVMGDGITHYYHQGPVFVDDPDPVKEEQLRWNKEEDTNIDTKDMGAVKGTDVRDLCKLVGGMSPGDTLEIKASDGMSKEFAYKNAYTPSARQGPMVITWYCTGSTFSTCSGPTPDSGYSDGMRLVFFADTSVNPWGYHVCGNFDWHESADPSDWYYYQSGSEKYPTTTGLSVKYVSEIIIHSGSASQLPVVSGNDGSGGIGYIPAEGSTPEIDLSRYGYMGSKLDTVEKKTINGTLLLLTDPLSTPAIVNARSREYVIPVTIPSDSNITFSRLYMYLSKSHGILSGSGVIPSAYVTINGEHIEQKDRYIDVNSDEKHDLSATIAFNTAEQVKKAGNYTILIRNTDADQSVFTADGVMLVIGIENETAPRTTFWINEGCDIISTNPKEGYLPADCKTNIPFLGDVNITTISSAHLTIMSTGIDGSTTTEHAVRFNDNAWYNSLDNSTIASNGVVFNVLPLINASSNTASIESTIRTQDADYLVNRNAIMILEERQNITFSGTLVPRKLVLSAGEPTAGKEATTIKFPTGANESCQLMLHTDPEGALIFLDDTYLGKTTPRTLQLEKNQTHSVRFMMEGYSTAQRNVTVKNDTCIREILYSPVHSTKGRSDEMASDHEAAHHGGLFIKSRPGGAIIIIDGVKASKTTPAVIYGISEGLHSVKMLYDLKDANSNGQPEFYFGTHDVWVYPSMLTLMDIAGTGSLRSREMIIDAEKFRGLSFTVNGYYPEEVIPAKVRAEGADSFITVNDNESFISYPFPMSLADETYNLLQPRSHYDLSVFVDSTPAGADIFIDGFPAQLSTPYTIRNISDGPHRIMVSKPGYFPEEKLIYLPYTALPVSTTTIKLTMDEYPSGFLKVNSTPEGSKISLDGISTGEVTPYLFSSIPTGDHEIKIADNNATKTFSGVTVNALEVTNIFFEQG